MWLDPLLKGERGADGDEGVPGADGAPGAPGATWRNGDGLPSNGTGIDGDYFLRTSNGDVYKRTSGTYSVIGNIKGPPGADGAPGSGGASEELGPVDLVLHETADQVQFEFMPPALIEVNDTMTDATLTRFGTILSEGTSQQIPTIAGGQMSLFHGAGGDKNTGIQEGNDIGIPQIAVSVNIVSRVGGANTYENVGVGIAKDGANFILALWRRQDNQASLQVKIGGTANFRAAVSCGAGWDPPFEIGFSLVGCSAVMWKRLPGGPWIKITSTVTYEAPQYVDMKTANLTGWKGVLWLATQSANDVTYVFDDFKIGRFGTVAFRDPCAVCNEDSSPRFTGNQVYLTATCCDPMGGSYCGVFTLNVLTRALAQTAVIMVARTTGGAPSIHNDTASQIIAYDDGTFRFFCTTWGSYQSPASGAYSGAEVSIQIEYKNETVLDLLSGARLVTGMAVLAVPLPASQGAYDPNAVKVGGLWYLAYSVWTTAPQTFYPALASSPDLVTWTAIGSDPSAYPYEGTRIVHMAGEYWMLSASGANGVNVYDLAMVRQGRMGSPGVAGYNPPHPTLVRHGAYVYQVTFDGTLVAGVANTMGHFRLLRARRYSPGI